MITNSTTSTTQPTQDVLSTEGRNTNSIYYSVAGIKNPPM